MRNIEFLEPHSPASDREVQILEHTLGVELPEELRLWFGRNNGGWPARDNYFIDRDDLRDVPCSIGVEEFLSIDQVLSVVKDYTGRIPADFLPIGHDGDGNYICVGLFGQLRGEVYFWDHENELAADELVGKKSPVSHTNLHFVASSFSEFLDMLGTSWWLGSE